MKFETDLTKIVVCTVPIGFNMQRAKIDLDLWPYDSNSIEFLLSSSTTYIWNFESDWTQTVVCIVPTKVSHVDFDPATQNENGSSSHHPQLMCDVWKWSNKNCSLYRNLKVL